MTNTTNDNGNGHRAFSLTFEDGFARFELPIEEFEVIERESKGMKTGVLARKFSESLTQANLAEGLGFQVINEAGEVEMGKKLSFLLETTSPRLIAAKAEAKLFRNFAANVRKYTGLVKTESPVAESRRLNSADLTDWLDGRRKVDGYDFDALPIETQEKIRDIAVKLSEQANGKGKVESALSILRRLMADEQAFEKLAESDQGEIKARIAQADKQTANLQKGKAAVAAV